VPPPVQITPEIVAEWRRLQDREGLDVHEAAERVGFSAKGLYKAEAARKPPAARRGPARRGTGRPAAGKRPPARLPKVHEDPLVELRATWGEIKAGKNELEGPKGLAQLANVEIGLAKTLEALGRGRRDAGAEVREVLARGPEALRKIRQGRAAIAVRELESGCCATCGGKLSEEQLAERKARATT